MVLGISAAEEAIGDGNANEEEVEELPEVGEGSAGDECGSFGREEGEGKEEDGTD